MNVIVDEQLSPNQVWFLSNTAPVSFLGAPGQVISWAPMFITNPATCGRIDGLTTQELVDPDLTVDVGL